MVIGSQAILGTFSEEDLPPETLFSMEADLAFPADLDDEKSDAIDGAIGEGSSFHEMNAYYAQGVSIATAILPAGWRGRVVSYDRIDASPSRAVCIEAHDLVISKLVAGREKDVEFAASLIRAQLVDGTTLMERADLLPVPGAVIRRVRATVARLAP